MNQNTVAPSVIEVDWAYTSPVQNKSAYAPTRAVKECNICLHLHHTVTPSTLCPHISSSSINSDYMRKSIQPTTISATFDCRSDESF